MDMCYLACAYRTPSGYCGSTGGVATCPHRQKKHTNADHIRSMTDEELAGWIADDLIEPGYNTREEIFKMWLDWLKQEANETDS